MLTPQVAGAIRIPEKKIFVGNQDVLPKGNYNIGDMQYNTNQKRRLRWMDSVLKVEILVNGKDLER